MTALGGEFGKRRWSLRGFGTFEVKTKAQKTARNITKNTTVIIFEHKVTTFKPWPEFKNSVKQPLQF